MSMLTRCPECGTSFRITTDQLVSRQGKVRCGRCQHVFSALSSLVHTRDPAAQPPSDSVILLEANSSVMPLDGISQLMPLDSPSYNEITIQPLEGGAGNSVQAPNTAPMTRPPRELAPHEEVPHEQEGFAAEPPPGRRFPWLSLLGVIAATLALGGQGAYFYRDQLAVMRPETKPWLLEMCARLACKIETPLDPQAISIETSALEADPADRTILQLSALLRNRSSLPQRLPYLELTMLDAQEAPLARRVLKPEEYANRGNAAASGPAPPLGADGEFQVKLSIDASQLKANGYRLYAFYP